MIIYNRPHFDNENPRKTRDLRVQKRDKNATQLILRKEAENDLEVNTKNSCIIF